VEKCGNNNLTEDILLEEYGDSTEVEGKHSQQ
jgi:hypothetical protein